MRLAAWASLGLIVFGAFAECNSLAAEDKAAAGNEGQVAIHLAPNKPLSIDIKMNGVDTPAVLDTGSSEVVVDDNSLEKFGLRRLSLSSARAVGGNVLTARLPDVSVEIGGTYHVLAKARSADLSIPSRARGFTYNVIAGMSLLNKNSLFLDFSNMKARFSDKSFLLKEGYKAQPLSEINGIPVLIVKINGQDARVAVDTGKDSDLEVSDAQFSRLVTAGAQATTIAAGGMGGIAVSRLAIVDGINFSGIKLDQVAVETAKSGSLLDALGVDAVAGLRVIQRFNVGLDLKAGQAYIASSGIVPPRLVKSTAGLQIAYGPTGRVVHVMKNSPAEAAAWKIGDEICSIDGHSIDEVSLSPSLRSWGTGKPGTIVKIGLCSGGIRTLVLKSFY